MAVTFVSVPIQKIGILSAKLNSENLYNSALLLYEKRFISPAIPLLILSGEELIKSFALCSEILMGNKSKIKALIESDRKQNDSYLFAHEDKLSLISVLLSHFSSISPTLNVINYFFKGKLKELIEFITITHEESMEVEKALLDLNDFNNKKKKGFYVDFIEGAWISPMGLEQKDYLIVLSTIDLIKSVFERKINYVLSTPDSELELVYQTANEFNNRI